MANIPMNGLEGLSDETDDGCDAVRIGITSPRTQSSATRQSRCGRLSASIPRDAWEIAIDLV
jgi:hypothetical protein